MSMGKASNKCNKILSSPIMQFLPITEFVITVPTPTEVPLLIKRFSSNTQFL